MEADLVQLLRSTRISRRAESSASLTTCSLCLSVQYGSEWLEAEHVIREMRSYELESPPHLHSGVCDSCAESIFARRLELAEPVAA